MNGTKICPKCGTPQQWEMWHKCGCGYDFGPPSQTSDVRRQDTNVRERYQTFWRRFWAGFVDGLVFLPVSIADKYLSVPERGPFILIGWAIISFNCYWLYSVLLHARYGQTFGKMAMHVKVLDRSEERIPTLRQAFMRDIGYIALNSLSLFYFIYLVLAGKYVRGAEISALPGQIIAWAGFGWFLLEIVTMATNTKRRAFHDYIAGTVVIRIT